MFVYPLWTIFYISVCNFQNIGLASSPKGLTPNSPRSAPGLVEQTCFTYVLKSSSAEEHFGGDESSFLKVL